MVHLLLISLLNFGDLTHCEVTGMMLVYVYIYIILCYASSIQCIVYSIDSIDSDPNKDKPVTSYSNSDALTNSFFGGNTPYAYIYILLLYTPQLYTHNHNLVFPNRLRSRAQPSPISCSVVAKEPHRAIHGGISGR
jgi:hypothetical protein